MEPPEPSAIFAALARQIFDGDGHTPAALRRSVGGRAGAAAAPPAIAPVVEKIRHHAYKVTDADLAALKAAGHDEEQIFELTIATALGAALTRMDRALAVVDARKEG